jgi:hypothetical protein
MVFNSVDMSPVSFNLAKFFCSGAGFKTDLIAVAGLFSHRPVPMA